MIPIMMTTKKIYKLKICHPKSSECGNSCGNRVSNKRSYLKIYKLVKRSNLWKLLHFDRIYRKMIVVPKPQM
ncbi:hypothetical protein FFZ96_13480 [Leptospira borgpetersenii]|nr:hypothetical protein LBHB_13980 [Leptospira borgpetersenii serovar Hardjo]TQE54814.1 hypothetical protein FFZ96_13480 [Leptospira borgpetersenii]